MSQLKKLKISSLKNYDKNNKKHGKNVDEIINSIKANTYITPIIVDENNLILAGHGRKLALEKMGVTEADVLVVEGLTESQKRDFRIRDNKLTELSEWNMENLKIELEELQIPELSNLFDGEIELDDGEVEEDEYVAPEIIETDIILGDLFEIGEHRLLCGDSTETEDIDKLMLGIKADMVFTDPPYLMDFTGGLLTNGEKSYNAKHGKIKNDKMSDIEGDNFLDRINENILKYCKGAFYIFFYRLGIGRYFESMKRVGLQCRSLIIRNKMNHTLSNSDYMSKYEPIFYGWVDSHDFFGGNNGVDIREIARTKKNELHPTMKPIQLCEKGIKDGSKQHGVVLDLFLGSGSTMVAAQQLKRKCYGMELDPKYCQVIIDRMHKLYPSLEIKKNGITYSPSND